MSERALFSCGNPHCAAEVSWPAKDLRMWEGRPICDVCYDAEATDNDLIWSDLPRFVPPYEQELAALRERIAAEERINRDQQAAIARLTEERDELKHTVRDYQADAMVLIQRNAEFEAERDRLRETLEWYASRGNWALAGGPLGGPPEAIKDGGKRACAALASKEPTDAS